MDNLTETKGDRIKILCDKYFDGNKRAMATAMGKASSSNLTEIISSRRNVIGLPTLEAVLVACPDVNREWLLDGNGPMDKKDVGNTKDGLPLIPYYAMAGYLTGDNDSIMEYECERYIIPEFKGADFLTRIKGDSMEPNYFSGDIVACKKNKYR